MTLLYNIYPLLFIGIKIVKRYAYMLSGDLCFTWRISGLSLLTRNFQASLSAENMACFYFHQPVFCDFCESPENWITALLQIPWVNAFLLLI